MKHKYLKGSYTLEAAVIFSVMFFILGTLIFCIFYIHDCAVAQSAACEAASVGTNFIKSDERKKAAEIVKDLVDGRRFMGSRNVKQRIAVGTKDVNAVWQGTYPMPGFSTGYLFGNKFSVRGAWSAKVLDPADMIRKIKGIGDVLTGGND